MDVKNTLFYKKSTLNCRGTLLDLGVPVIMGILNLSPDSFYRPQSLKTGKNRTITTDQLLQLAEGMIRDGAGILDIGGMSSRPGAELIPEETEMKRVIPAIEALHQHFPEAILSVDTVRAGVARRAVEAGAGIVNDISGGKFDPELWPTVAELKVPYVLMHMQGTPADMQVQPAYEDVAGTIVDYFADRLAQLHEHGIHDVVIDPGFGFGKTVTHNYQLLHALDQFKIFGNPLMIGISRKSMICKPLAVNPAQALNGTTALHAIALSKGVSILRVHDVKEARECITLMEQYDRIAV